MSDLERLDEAIPLVAQALNAHVQGCDEFDLGAVALLALRRYRDLLANGEWVEPDYEAAAAVLARHYGLSFERLSNGARRIVGEIVDAAIGSKLLIDHPKEAEDE